MRTTCRPRCKEQINTCRRFRAWPDGLIGLVSSHTSLVSAALLVTKMQIVPTNVGSELERNVSWMNYLVMPTKQICDVVVGLQEMSAWSTSATVP